jgi:hypothetical protein
VSRKRNRKRTILPRRIRRNLKSKPEQAPNDPKKNEDLLAAGFLYSSRQMAAAFTNKVKEHYKVRNKAQDGPDAESKAEEGRSVDALMDRLNLLHTMM